MRTRFHFRHAQIASLAWVAILACCSAATPSAQPGDGGAEEATVKQISGAKSIKVVQDGRESSRSTGEKLKLPAQIHTANSRVILTMENRKIALGLNSTCTIDTSGDVTIDTKRGGSVAVQPVQGTTQTVYFFQSEGQTDEGALAWEEDELTESAGEGQAGRNSADYESLGIVYAPPKGSVGYCKVMLMEGDAKVRIGGGEPQRLMPNEMACVRVREGSYLDRDIKCADFDLKLAVETSALIQDFSDCWDLDRVQQEIRRQEAEIRAGLYVSFRKGQERRGARTGVEDRRIIRSLRKVRKKGH